MCVYSQQCLHNLTGIINGIKTEIRMTASILKQDPNRKRLKKALFNRTKHNMQFFRVTVFIKLQSDTITCVKNSSTVKRNEQ